MQWKIEMDLFAQRRSQRSFLGLLSIRLVLSYNQIIKRLLIHFAVEYSYISQEMSKWLLAEPHG